jgi:hypothetical protein
MQKWFLRPPLTRPPAKVRTFDRIFLASEFLGEGADRAAFEVEPEHGADRLGLLRWRQKKGWPMTPELGQIPKALAAELLPQ